MLMVDNYYSGQLCNKRIFARTNQQKFHFHLHHRVMELHLTMHHKEGSVGHSRSMSAPSNDSTSENWNVSPHSFYRLPKGWNRVFSCKRIEKYDLRCRQAALEQDVAELQLRLKDERAVRDALEHISEPLSNAMSPSHPNVKPETRELITEIATLEGEVAHLEQHVLFLYRKVFDQRLSGTSELHDELSAGKCSSQQEQLKTWGLLRNAFRLRKSPSPQHHRHVSVSPRQQCFPDGLGVSKNIEKTLIQSEFDRTVEVMDMQSPEAQAHAASESFCPLFSYSFETPNRLSEELVRCMAAIYCKLSGPPLAQAGVPKPQLLTSSSFTSYTNINNLRQYSGDSWSPRWRTGSRTTSLGDPFKVEVSSENIGTYSSMVEVHWIYVDKCRLEYTSQALCNFRLMIIQLEKVDPGSLKHDEKLAFWINIYNALMMHTYLAYGIPRHHLKRVSLLQKAAYRIGPYTINADTIEQFLLGCKHHRPAKWLQTFLSPLTKSKSGEDRHALALYSLEPLACFALCCGGRSDPAIRVYSAKNIRNELEAAMHDFLQARIGISKDNRVVLLPRILEWYTRAKGVNTKNLLGWICQNIPEKQSVIEKCTSANVHKSSAQCLEWLPYDFSFRYILVPDLACRFPQSTHQQQA
ncbi:hypothetical protein O6H91_17G000900 [Diphasiastrum complanatum]|uniref:Uncharacterized protein n=1 Tax=Diphasiastrum complanatum TaxID=34168 RepID=A0ACC2B3L8_DIPCM|nr:hypothetical protein O6H91_17G000900 [Diphasiastrum complanatum]